MRRGFEWGLEHCRDVGGFISRHYFVTVVAGLLSSTTYAGNLIVDLPSYRL